MKVFIISLLSVCSIGLMSCSKSSSDPQPSQPSNNQNNSSTSSEIKATVADSPAFAAVGDVQVVNGVRIASTDPADAPARLVLRGTVSTNNITLTLIKFNGVGTYQLKADPNAAIGTSIASYSENGSTGPYFYTQYMANPGATVGQVVVTSYDASAKRVRGTFSFTGSTLARNGVAATTKQVTNGTFDVYGVALF